ncbi:MAG TPA: hypothetical protein VKF62_08670, partial [Planctomycetota bacterium]|nr:hypothetical protein [Planctomycetota bacterium]
MRPNGHRGLGRLVLVLAAAGLGSSALAGAAVDGGGSKSLGGRSPFFATPPLTFVENRGQWDGPARLVARRGAMVAWLEASAITVRLSKREEEGREQGVVVRLRFEGASETTAVEGEGLRPGAFNYFLGNDPAGWRTGVPSYAGAIYRGVYDGVDLRIREESGRLEYDLLLASGASLDRVLVRCEGIEGLDLEADGSLSMRTPHGRILQSRPRAWIEVPDGGRRPVDCRFRLLDTQRYGFEAPDLDPTLPLVVDPGLEWSTFLGDAGFEAIWACARDSSGNTVVAGHTRSALFPASPGAYDTAIGGVQDGFAACLSEDGSTLIWATFLGGAWGDRILDVALDTADRPTLVGQTSSADFPTTASAYDTTFNAILGLGGDAFVARLDATGSSLLYSTFLGGTSPEEWAAGVALDPSGAALVGGLTGSFSTFPVTPGAFQTAYGGGARDAFVARLSLAGNGPADLVYATFLGGLEPEGTTLLPDDPIAQKAGDLAVAPSGEVTVATWTASSDFPTTAGAYDTTFNGVVDAAVTRLNAGGSALLFSTFLGGVDDDEPTAVDLDPTGAAVVAGWSYSPDFPSTPGAPDTTFGGFFSSEPFLVRLGAPGGALLYSTYLGGAATGTYEAALDLVCEGSGTVVVTGFTGAPDLPTTAGAYQTFTSNVGANAFVLRLLPIGSGAADLLYSTYLGPAFNGNAYGLGLAVDGTGAATVAGATVAASFPTTNGAYDTVYGGGSDGFVTRLDLLPAGAVKFGDSTPGCAGPLAIGVNSMPQVGNAGFALRCSSAPVTSSGVIGLSTAGLATPLAISGLAVWIDPNAPGFFAAPVASDAFGASAV